MKTKTKIGKQLGRKSNKELVEAILTAKKKEKWLRVAGILSGPRRKKISLNLEDINESSKSGETVVVPGKILSQGEISKNIKIVAQSFSEKAKEKLLKSKIAHSDITKEIKENPDMKKCRVLLKRK